MTARRTATDECVLVVRRLAVERRTTQRGEWWNGGYADSPEVSMQLSSVANSLGILRVKGYNVDRSGSRRGCENRLPPFSPLLRLTRKSWRRGWEAPSCGIRQTTGVTLTCICS